jgi:hypothetical protein
MGDSIKMDLEINEMGREDWIHVPQGLEQVARSCELRNETSDQIKCEK